MYIEGLYSDSMPVLQEWGSAYKHVPLNIKSETRTDEDGEEKTSYVYDCVERVPVPVTVDGIVKTALEAKFSVEDIAYVQANIFKSADSKVKAYSEFAAKINSEATEAGY